MLKEKSMPRALSISSSFSSSSFSSSSPSFQQQYEQQQQQQPRPLSQLLTSRSLDTNNESTNQSTHQMSNQNKNEDINTASSPSLHPTHTPSHTLTYTAPIQSYTSTQPGTFFTENYRIMFHMMTQDHKLPDLIWNERTRLELRVSGIGTGWCSVEDGRREGDVNVGSYISYHAFALCSYVFIFFCFAHLLLLLYSLPCTNPPPPSHPSTRPPVLILSL